jgi:transposase
MMAIGQKNDLFVGSEAGGKAAAVAYPFVETAKLNGTYPSAWLSAPLARVSDCKFTKTDI